MNKACPSPTKTRVQAGILQPIEAKSGPAPEQFPLGAIEAEPTRHHENDSRVGSMQILEIEPRGVLPGSAEKQLSAGEEDELWHPLPRSHEWIEPFPDRRSGFGSMSGAAFVTPCIRRLMDAQSLATAAPAPIPFPMRPIVQHAAQRRGGQGEEPGPPHGNVAPSLL